MSGEVVEHHNIATPQCGHEDWLDVGEERGAVDRAIQHGFSNQSNKASGGR